MKAVFSRHYMAWRRGELEKTQELDFAGTICADALTTGSQSQQFGLQNQKLSELSSSSTMVLNLDPPRPRS